MSKQESTLKAAVEILNTDLLPKPLTAKTTDSHVEDEKRSELEVFQLIDPAEKTAFKNSMECPVCSDICVPPVFVCRSGHHICENCVKVVKKCGKCSTDYKEGRIFFYDELIDNSSFPCKYFNQGCKETILGKEIKDHRMNCQYKPIDCFHCPTDNIPYTKYVEHLANCKSNEERGIVHSSNGEFENSYGQEFSEPGTWHMNPVQFDGNTFIPVVVQDGKRNPNLGVFVWIFGNDENSKKYAVQICMESTTRNIGGKKPKYWTAWEGPVVPIREPVEKVLDNGNCLITTAAAVKTAYGENEYDWNVSYQIIPVAVPKTNDPGSEAVQRDLDGA